jgi:glycosyltransferase 2 family protein
MKINKKNIFSSLILITSFVLIIYFIKKIDYEKFKLLFLNFNNNFFIASYLICIIQTLLNIGKFNLILSNPVNKIKLSKIFFISSLLNFILPLKLGELKKIHLLKKHFKIDYLKSLEVIIVDKIFEISFYIFFSIFIFSFWKEIELIFVNLIIVSCLVYLFFFKKIIFFLSKKNINLFEKIKNVLIKYTLKFNNLKRVVIINIFLLVLTFIHFKIFITFLNIDDFSIFNIVSFVSLISLVGFIPVTYNGLGFREFFIVIIFGQLFTIEQIVLIGVFFISRSIPSAIIGLVFLAESFLKKIK